MFRKIHIQQTLHYLRILLLKHQNKIDIPLVERVADEALVKKFLKIRSNLDSGVGERGIKLSGGQRQRIGIARALYKRSGLIIFDEAASSLDEQTETEIMDTIYNLDNELTILCCT